MKIIHLTEVRISRNWLGRTRIQVKRTGEMNWSDVGTVPRGHTVTVNCPVEAYLGPLWAVEQ